MSLISMAVWDTEENQRTKYTRRTLESLMTTVDWSKHRLIISDNNSCQETKDLYIEFQDKFPFTVIYNTENLGTAGAVNLAWRTRKEGEHAIKVDNDIVIHYNGWVDELEEVIKRDPKIGQASLKRKDIWECPWNNNEFYRSTLRMLPHEAGERWIIVEDVNSCIGSCVMHSDALLQKVPYLQQFSKYGLEDTIQSIKSKILGFSNVFLSHIPIDHIDEGGDEYTKWKKKEASLGWKEYQDLVRGMQEGKIPVYYNPFENKN